MLVLIVVIGMGMAGLLMLNTTLQNQAFQARDAQPPGHRSSPTPRPSLEDRLDSVGAPQELARRASALGMRPNPYPALLKMPKGKVIGKPQAGQRHRGAQPDDQDPRASSQRRSWPRPRRRRRKQAKAAAKAKAEAAAAAKKKAAAVAKAKAKAEAAKAKAKAAKKAAGPGGRGLMARELRLTTCPHRRAVRHRRRGALRTPASRVRRGERVLRDGTSSAPEPLEPDPRAGRSSRRVGPDPTLGIHPAAAGLLAAPAARGADRRGRGAVAVRRPAAAAAGLRLRGVRRRVRRSSPGPCRCCRPAGEITDRNGLVLASTEPAVAVTADPKLTAPQGGRDAPSILARHLGMTEAELMPLLTKPNTRFVYLKKKVPALTYSALAADLASGRSTGIFRESDPIRTYPDGAVGSSVVGFVGADGKGLAGLELSLNDELAGVEGKETYESAPNGSKIPLGQSSITPAPNGINTS